MDVYCRNGEAGGLRRGGSMVNGVCCGGKANAEGFGAAGRPGGGPLCDKCCLGIAVPVAS